MRCAPHNRPVYEAIFNPITPESMFYSNSESNNGTVVYLAVR